MKAFIVKRCVLHVYHKCRFRVAVRVPGVIQDFVFCQKVASSSDVHESVFELLVLTSSNKVYCVQIIADNRTDGARDENNDVDVFSELLDSESASDIPVLLDDVIKLDATHLILECDETLTRIEVADKLLLTLSQSTGTVKAYKLDDLIPSSNGTIQSPCLQIKCPSTGFRSTHEKSSLFVIASEDNMCENMVSLKTIKLPQSLFISLLGSETALLNSQILLYTLKGGVWYAPIKTRSKMDECWHILCYNENCVQNILPVVMKSEMKSDLFSMLESRERMCDTGLLVVSSNGKSVLLHTDITGCPRHSTVTFPQKVVASAVWKTDIYHSTGERVLRHSVVLKGDNSVVLETELLHQASISKITVDEMSGEQSTEPQLLCKGKNGNILNLPTAFCEGNESRDKPFDVKQLLVELAAKKKEQAKVHQRKVEIDNFLEQVNIAACLINKVPHGCGDGVPVSSSVSVASVRNGYKREYNLICKLINHCSVSLSPDWHVLISLDSENNSAVQTRSHTVNLSCGVQGGADFEMRVPLERECLSANCCDVRIVLVLHSDVLTDQSSFPLSGAVPHTSSLALPVLVGAHRLDILHYLSEPVMGNTCKREGCHQAGGPVSGYTSSVPRLYHMNVPLGQAQIPVEQAHPQEPDTVRMLRWFLKDSQVQPETITKSHIDLNDPDGHSLRISLSVRDCPGEGHPFPEVHLSSPYIHVLARCRLALIQRLKDVSQHTGCKLSGESIKHYLLTLEKLKEETLKLEEDMRENIVTQESGLHALAEVFEKLRNISPASQKDH